MFIFVCVGMDAFRSAQEHNKDRDFSALVLTADQDPRSLRWPVTGCPVVIEWDGAANEESIIELVRCLLRSQAESVTVWPTFVKNSEPIFYYDLSKPSGQNWIPAREHIKTYYPKAAKNAAK